MRIEMEETHKIKVVTGQWQVIDSNEDIGKEMGKTISINNKKLSKKGFMTENLIPK